MSSILRGMKSAGILALLAVIAIPAGYADERKGDAYSLGTCPVSGEKLGSMGDPIVLVKEGREVRLCCNGCTAKFEKETAKYMEKVDAAMIEQQAKVYPTDACVVSGKKLDDTARSKIVGNRLMKFCCDNCPKAAAADPAKFIAKLDAAAIEKQSASYALKTCVVGGESLTAKGEPVVFVVANQVVKLCCANCKTGFDKDPAKYLSMLNQ